MTPLQDHIWQSAGFGDGRERGTSCVPAILFYFNFDSIRFGTSDQICFWGFRPTREEACTWLMNSSCKWWGALNSSRAFVLCTFSGRGFFYVDAASWRFLPFGPSRWTKIWALLRNLYLTWFWFILLCVCWFYWFWLILMLFYCAFWFVCSWTTLLRSWLVNYTIDKLRTHSVARDCESVNKHSKIKQNWSHSMKYSKSTIKSRKLVGHNELMKKHIKINQNMFNINTILHTH